MENPTADNSLPRDHNITKQDGQLSQSQMDEVDDAIRVSLGLTP